MRCLNNTSPSATPVFIGFPDEKGRWGGVLSNAANVGIRIPFGEKKQVISFVISFIIRIFVADSVSLIIN